MARKPTKPAADTRENLIRLAARLFGAHGYSATLMRAIAEQADIEVASIYHHFPSKEALIDTVLQHGAETIVQMMKDHIAALPPSADAEQRFKAALAGQMTGMIRFGDYTVVSGRLLAQLPDLTRERQIKRRQQYHAFWTKLLADLRDEGFLRPDVDLGLCRIFIQGAINSTQSWYDPKKGSLERVADALCAIFLDGVRPADGRREAGRPLSVVR